jgi:hypothetical protein
MSNVSATNTTGTSITWPAGYVHYTGGDIPFELPDTPKPVIEVGDEVEFQGGDFIVTAVSNFNLVLTRKSYKWQIGISHEMFWSAGRMIRKVSTEGEREEEEKEDGYVCVWFGKHIGLNEEKNCFYNVFECHDCYNKAAQTIGVDYAEGESKSVVQVIPAEKCPICSGDRYVMFEGKSLPCGRCNFATEKPEDRRPEAPYHVIEDGVCYLNSRRDYWLNRTESDAKGFYERLKKINNKSLEAPQPPKDAVNPGLPVS